MRTLLVGIAMLAAQSSAAPARDGMEVQRCVWRCLADSAGADDPAYHACVDRVCVSTPEPAPAPPPPAGPAWQVAAPVADAREAWVPAREGAERLG